MGFRKHGAYDPTDARLKFTFGLVLGTACDAWACVHMVTMTSLASVENLHFRLVLESACDAWISVHMMPMTSPTFVDNLHSGLVLGIAFDTRASANMVL